MSKERIEHFLRCTEYQIKSVFFIVSRRPTAVGLESVLIPMQGLQKGGRFWHTLCTDLLRDSHLVLQAFCTFVASLPLLCSEMFSISFISAAVWMYTADLVQSFWRSSKGGEEQFLLLLCHPIPRTCHHPCTTAGKTAELVDIQVVCFYLPGDQLHQSICIGRGWLFKYILNGQRVNLCAPDSGLANWIKDINYCTTETSVASSTSKP